MKKESKTDWKRLDRINDEQIDTSDIPALDEVFFKNATLRIPEDKRSITMRLDADIVDWYKSQGKGYQTRINAVLRMYMEAQKK